MKNILLTACLFLTLDAQAADAPFHMNKVLRSDQGEVTLINDHAIDITEDASKKPYVLTLNFLKTDTSKPTCSLSAKSTKIKGHTTIYKNGACQFTVEITGETVSTVQVNDSAACMAVATTPDKKPCPIVGTVDFNGSYSFGF